MALNAAGQWAEIVDRNWRLVYTTDDLRLAQGAMLHLASVPLGAHYYSAEAMSAREQWRIGPVMVDVAREGFGAMVGAWMLADTAGGRRWVVEACHSWMNRNRGLLIRWSKKDCNHLALMHLAAGLIAFKKAHGVTLAAGLPA